MESEKAKLLALAAKKYICKKEQETRGRERQFWEEAQRFFADADVGHPIASPGNLITNGIIGEGGFGSVANGYFRHINTPVAVKKMIGNSSVAANECNLLKLCAHPGVVSLFGTFQMGTSCFMVLECAHGSVFDIIQHRGRMDVRSIVKMSLQVLVALKFIHSRRIIHRDLKLENILIASNSFKICDFGLAIEIKEGESLPYQDTWPCGTPGKMAPESVLSYQYFYESDLYAVGIMLYEAYVGRHMFDLNAAMQNSPVHAMNKEHLKPDWVAKRIRPLMREPIYNLAKSLLSYELQDRTNYEMHARKLKEDFKINDVLKDDHPVRARVPRAPPCPADFFKALEQTDDSASQFRTDVASFLHYFVDPRLVPRPEPVSPLKRRILELDTSCKNWAMKNAQQTAQILANEEDIKSDKRKIEENEREIRKAAADNSALRSQIEALKAEKAKLEQQALSQQEALSEAVNQNNVYEIRVNLLEASVEHLTKENSEAQERLATSQLEAEMQRKRNGDLESRLKELQDMGSASRSESGRSIHSNHPTPLRMETTTSSEEDDERPDRFSKIVAENMPRPIPASCSLQAEARTVRKNLGAEKKKRNECPQCSKKFSKTSNLNRHMISHNDRKPFKCQVCNAKFKRSDYLADHCRREHDKLKDKICKKCNEGFATRTQLFHHKCNKN